MRAQAKILLADILTELLSAPDGGPCALGSTFHLYFPEPHRCNHETASWRACVRACIDVTSRERPRASDNVSYQCGKAEQLFGFSGSYRHQHLGQACLPCLLRLPCHVRLFWLHAMLSMPRQSSCCNGRNSTVFLVLGRLTCH